MQIQHHQLADDTTNYALLQSYQGETYVNAANGRKINLRFNNNKRAEILNGGSTGLRLQQYYSRDSTSNRGTFSLGNVCLKVIGTAWVTVVITSSSSKHI